jgi:hypothetical protein
MMKTKEAQTIQKRIEDLTLRELDRIYSLVRIGDWPDKEISRVYTLSVDDVHKVFDNYPQLRAACLRNPPRDVLPQAPELELTTGKARKRRSDAQYATPAERQAAYRYRLQENLRTGIEQPSPTVNTDTLIPVEEPSVTVCEALVPEIGPGEAETQHLGSYGSSVEGGDISESVPLSVTPEACSENEGLRLIEE